MAATHPAPFYREALSHSSGSGTGLAAVSLLAVPLSTAKIRFCFFFFSPLRQLSAMHKIAADLNSGAEKNGSHSGFLKNLAQAVKKKKEEAAFLTELGRIQRKAL